MICHILLILATSSSLFACHWCTGKPIRVLETLKSDARRMAERSVLAPKISDAEDMHIGAGSSIVAVDSLATEYIPSRFSADYLEQYFPRMPVIIDQILPTMCPQAALAMVRDIVWFVHDTPAKYFSNQLFPLYRIHYEIVREQLIELLAALEHVEIIDNRLVVQEVPAHTNTLIQYARDTDNDAIILLTALVTDFAVQFCYRAVRFQVYAEGYTELETLNKYRRKLRGTRFEKEYNEMSSHYATLVEMLRARLWSGKVQRESELW